MHSEKSNGVCAGYSYRERTCLVQSEIIDYYPSAESERIARAINAGNPDSKGVINGLIPRDNVFAIVLNVLRELDESNAPKQRPRSRSFFKLLLFSFAFFIFAANARQTVFTWKGETIETTIGYDSVISKKNGSSIFSLKTKTPTTSKLQISILMDILIYPFSEILESKNITTSIFSKKAPVFQDRRKTQ
jgi:hypothetical protein